MTHSNKHIPILPSSDWGLITLKNSSGLSIELLPGGAVRAIRHGPTLINQYLPHPAEQGLSRLYVRISAATRPPALQSSAFSPSVFFNIPLATHGQGFEQLSPASARWTTAVNCKLQTALSDGGETSASATLTLHPAFPAWTWRIQITNTNAAPIRAKAFFAQDLGLADEAAVRNNEAYNSHYIDILPVESALAGPVLLARQNLAQSGGAHPWLALACATGSAAWSTDALQFFGSAHRLFGEPLALRAHSLPSQRLQYECALAALQSRIAELAPGETAEIVFAARYLPDHPGVSVAADLAHLRELTASPIPLNLRIPAAPPEPGPPPAGPAPLFVSGLWIHGARPSAADLDRWFPGPRRHEEFLPATPKPQTPNPVHETASGSTLRTLNPELRTPNSIRPVPASFFTAENTHVVTRAKETAIIRPHGHILRSGDWRWIDPAQFSVTSYASGIFRAHACAGNPDMARLLPPVRNTLNILRSSGERIFIRPAGSGHAAWRQLGIPSAFAMTPSDARWFYFLPDHGLLRIRVWCSPTLPASWLELTLDGAPAEFLFTYTPALGPVEHEHGGSAEINTAESCALLRPAPGSFLAKHEPGLAFAIATHTPGAPAVFADDTPLYPTPPRHAASAVLTLRTEPLARIAVILTGAAGSELPALITAARAELAAPPTPNPGLRTLNFSAAPASAPPPVNCELKTANSGTAVSAVSELLPWYAHNAAIHFTAPHGLEQYGGGAWGVRDVCQGSLEYLLTLGDHAAARRMLLDVFAQQYAQEGDWPQWYMHPPYRHVQQTRAHGDIPLWPIKALCDYIEASNDFAILHEGCRYTDRERFEPSGTRESILRHCYAALAHCKRRFLRGTALINHGDGDWDDTLQPADPALRTRMVSAWTVALSYHAIRQFADVCQRADEFPANRRSARLDSVLNRIRSDFNTHLMPDATVAGFLVRDPGGATRHLLHPRDNGTGIHCRLIPMTRAILAELFTPEQAAHHLDIIRRELLFPDGARLMPTPVPYNGGAERLFKRADTAANFGREIGLQYVHAHLRYAEALAKTGRADEFWHALRVVNPVGLSAILPNAAPRQANTYFSSSDAGFFNRYDASALWPKVRAGTIPVYGGWRLYSSGPGLFLHKIRACLLGLRESFGNIIIDPVIPKSLDGLTAHVTLCERPATIRYRVRENTYAPSAITINGTALSSPGRSPNPYRAGGLVIPATQLAALLRETGNTIEIQM